MKKTIKVPRELTRAGVLSEVTSGDKKTKRISISSDTPYLRYDWMAGEDYYEVLSHAPGDVDESRLKLGLPALFNHRRDSHLGRATQYNNDGHRIEVGSVEDMIWSESDDAQTKKKDVQNGSLVGTSVGYEILDEGECIGAKDGIPIFKFKWAPHEFSFCTIEADTTVGAGRSRNADESDPPNLKEIHVDVKKDVDVPNDSANNTPTKPKPMLRTSTKRFFKNDGSEGGADDDGGTAVIDPVKERNEAVAAYKAKCKKIDDFVKALRNPEWQKNAEVIGAKHKLGEANFEEFRTEANNSFTDDNSIEAGSVIEFIRERDRNPQGGRGLSIGAQFIRSKDFKERGGQTGRQRSIAMEIDTSILGIRGKVALAQRAGFVSSDLSAVNVQIQQGVVGLGVQRLTIMDLIAPGTTGAAAIIYPLENSFGNLNDVAFSTSAGVMPKAQNVGERGVKPQWDPDLTTATANVKKIAVVTKVPDEFMADFPAAQSYIDERLPYMVDTQTEQQLLYGDGVGNNIKGITTFAGIQTRAITTTDDSTKAASLLQGLTDIRVGSMFEPDAYAFHPYDWETASLLKDTAGRFLAGGPYYIPYSNGVFMELHTFWGKPVVVTTSVTYGRPLAGCFKLGAQYFIREGMRLEMTNSNEDDFKRNLIAIRAEHRLALAVYRPACFLEFTGFPARA